MSWKGKLRISLLWLYAPIGSSIIGYYACVILVVYFVHVRWLISTVSKFDLGSGPNTRPIRASFCLRFAHICIHYHHRHYHCEMNTKYVYCGACMLLYCRQALRLTQCPSIFMTKLFLMMYQVDKMKLLFDAGKFCLSAHAYMWVTSYIYYSSHLFYEHFQPSPRKL